MKRETELRHWRTEEDAGQDTTLATGSNARDYSALLAWTKWFHFTDSTNRAFLTPSNFKSVLFVCLLMIVGFSFNSYFLTWNPINFIFVSLLLLSPLDRLSKTLFVVCCSMKSSPAVGIYLYRHRVFKKRKMP